MSHLASKCWSFTRLHIPHSYKISVLFGHCVLSTRFVSSFVPDKFVNGKPTPIFKAAAVGNTCLSGTAWLATCFGVDVFNGGRMMFSMELSDLAGHRANIDLCKRSILSINSVLCAIC